jgi:hypothetical protein
MRQRACGSMDPTCNLVIHASSMFFCFAFIRYPLRAWDGV